MDTKIGPSELKAGDVLLYHGTSFVNKLIRLFDGSEYSHASIYNNGGVLEAISEGVKKTPLVQSVHDQTFVDVYRFVSSDGKAKLGDNDYPPQPVLDRMQFYESEGDRYAYEQLLFLALLSTTRRIDVPIVAWLLREILDSAASILNKIIAMGKEPMICSELVYRCYSEAAPLPKYALTIRGADIPLTAADLPLASIAADHPLNTQLLTQNEAKKLTAQMEDFLATYAMSKHRTKSKFESLSLASTASLLAVADFVTPKDLKQSPNLFAVGTLQIP